MKFLGAFSIYHVAKNQEAINENLRIKTAKWVKNLCMMVIHQNNNTIALVANHTQLRILAHSKY